MDVTVSPHPDLPDFYFSPLKLFEYFAGGKPVISSPMPECAAFPGVRIVRNAEQLSAALDPRLRKVT